MPDSMSCTRRQTIRQRAESAVNRTDVELMERVCTEDVPALLEQLDEVDGLRAALAEAQRGLRNAEEERDTFRTERNAAFVALRDALGTDPATLGQATLHAVKAVADLDAARTEAERLRAELAKAKSDQAHAVAEVARLATERDRARTIAANAEKTLGEQIDRAIAAEAERNEALARLQQSDELLVAAHLDLCKALDVRHHPLLDVIQHAATVRAERAEYRDANNRMQELIVRRAVERDRALSRQRNAEAERDRLRAELEDARVDLKSAEMQRDDYRTAHKTAVAELDEARRERDLAIAHDRQPYPTPWAYEQACRALEEHRQRADKAKGEQDRLKADRDRLKDERNRRAAQVQRATQVRVWRNEDGKGFVFADDLRAALDGTETAEQATPADATSPDPRLTALEELADRYSHAFAVLLADAQARATRKEANDG